MTRNSSLGHFEPITSEDVADHWLYEDIRAGRIPFDGRQTEPRGLLEILQRFGPDIETLYVRGESMAASGIVPDDMVTFVKGVTPQFGDIVMLKADGMKTIKQWTRWGLYSRWRHQKVKENFAKAEIVGVGAFHHRCIFPPRVPLPSDRF